MEPTYLGVYLAPEDRLNMPLPLPEYADVLCKALWCFSFPKVTFDFRNSQRTQHEDMRGVEKCIGALLSHEDPVDVKDGLSNVLYWGYARQQGRRRGHKVRTFRNMMKSTDHDRRLVGFMEFVGPTPDTRVAERLPGQLLQLGEPFLALPSGVRLGFIPRRSPWSLFSDLVDRHRNGSGRLPA